LDGPDPINQRTANRKGHKGPNGHGKGRKRLNWKGAFIFSMARQLRCGGEEIGGGRQHTTIEKMVGGK